MENAMQRAAGARLYPIVVDDAVNAALTYAVIKRDGRTVTLDINKILSSIDRATQGLKKDYSVELIMREVVKNLFNNIPSAQIEDALILSTSAFIEKDPVYSTIAARFLLQKIYKSCMRASVTVQERATCSVQAFVKGINAGVEAKIFSPELLNFDLEFLARKLVVERDQLFGFLGLQTISDRYLTRIDKQYIELPQAFWMRVAMGLALHETHKEERAVEFYEVLSTLRAVSSTPTLMRSGLINPQLSSCFLATVEDDLTHIFKCFGDIAQMSKWSGGVANDWTNIRATSAMIDAIKVESQGLIPFLKISNDVTAAINRSGKRRSATVAYLEVWHLDIEDFCDLRRNTGDERRRAHDMNFASWIPDLFIKRVLEDGQWTLFSPHEVPDLHHIYGKKFEDAYIAYEQAAQEGGIVMFKQMRARDLWRRMLTRLFETGYPWITFKDPCNIRSPQDHAGVVHSSNLCTEITLNTSAQETAVCNLASVNLARHVVDGRIDDALFEQTVTTAIRMLDNVIDINYYPTPEGRTSNMRHRPIGLGMMGFQDALFKLDYACDSDDAIEFADAITEKMSYHAIMASSKLARERGTYQSYIGSKWDRGIFPVDTLDLLEQERGIPVETPRAGKLDWAPVREHVSRYGMRNSNTMAIAPTATIANIAGCYPCIEPLFSNLYVKSNMAGEFTIINEYLVEDLKKVGLWDQDMLDQIKYFDGTIQEIERIPEHLRAKYKGAFDLDPLHLMKMTARRSKWVDQSISHNVFMKGVSGSKLSDLYIAAWRMGVKTCYYLRTMAASQIEKSTLDAKKFGYTQKRTYAAVETESTQPASEPLSVARACGIDNSDCEACQ